MVTSCGSLKFELPSRIQLGARPDIVTNRLPNAVAAGREDEAGRITSLGDEMPEMSPGDVQTVVALLVDRVGTRDQPVVRVVPTGPARPFFDAASVGVLAPPDGLGDSPPGRADPLAWCASA